MLGPHIAIRLCFADRLSLRRHHLDHTMLGAQPNATRDKTWEFSLLFFRSSGSGAGVVVANGGWVYRAWALVVFRQREWVARARPRPEVVTGCGGSTSVASPR